MSWKKWEIDLKENNKKGFALSRFVQISNISPRAGIARPQVVQYSSVRKGQWEMELSEEQELSGGWEGWTEQNTILLGKDNFSY